MRAPGATSWSALAGSETSNSAGRRRCAAADREGGTSDFRQSSAFFKDGNVTGHVIGVSVASGWMDLERDFDNVSSFDNQVNLGSSEISLPSMSILPEGG